MLIALMAALIMTIAAVSGSNAQDMGPVVRNLFYIAADEGGVLQVFTQTIGGDNDEARQVTQSATDVHTYGVASDVNTLARSGYDGPKAPRTTRGPETRAPRPLPRVPW